MTTTCAYIVPLWQRESVQMFPFSHTLFRSCTEKETIGGGAVHHATYQAPNDVHGWNYQYTLDLWFDLTSKW